MSKTLFDRSAFQKCSYSALGFGDLFAYRSEKLRRSDIIIELGKFWNAPSRNRLVHPQKPLWCSG